LNKIIKPAIRIECLDGDEADKIPPLFWKRYNKNKPANGQEFLLEDYVKTFQLAHMSENESFGEFYEAIHRKYTGKLQLKNNKELQDLCTMCILDYKVLGGCDLQWKETAAPSQFIQGGAVGDDDDQPAGEAGGSGSTRSTGSTRGAAAPAAAPAATAAGAGAPEKAPPPPPPPLP
jgi:hypothetical protein